MFNNAEPILHLDEDIRQNDAGVDQSTELANEMTIWQNVL